MDLETVRVKLALNTPVFLRMWRKMLDLGIWRQHDWIVKAEADTVFFPGRLQDLLYSRPLLPVPGALPIGVDSQQCGNCSSQPESTCETHVKWVQKQGHTCSEALRKISSPTDCACHCGPEVCHDPTTVYVRNCPTNYYQPGQKQANKALHGPLEVLSRSAWTVLDKGLDHCKYVLQDSYRQWGEDWFLEHCLLNLGVSPLDLWKSLYDMDCDPDHSRDASCWPAAAAFQPYKTVEAYSECVYNAGQSTWPPAGVTSHSTVS